MSNPYDASIKAMEKYKKVLMDSHATPEQKQRAKKVYEEALANNRRAKEKFVEKENKTLNLFTKVAAKLFSAAKVFEDVKDSKGFSPAGEKLAMDQLTKDLQALKTINDFRQQQDKALALLQKHFTTLSDWFHCKNKPEIFVESWEEQQHNDYSSVSSEEPFSSTLKSLLTEFFDSHQALINQFCIDQIKSVREQYWKKLKKLNDFDLKRLIALSIADLSGRDRLCAFIETYLIICSKRSFDKDDDPYVHVFYDFFRKELRRNEMPKEDIASLKIKPEFSAQWEKILIRLQSDLESDRYV